MEENKKSKLRIGILIGLLVAIIIGLAGFIVYDKVLSNDNNEQIENENNNEETITCDDCIAEIILPDLFEEQETEEKNILLGNQIRKLKVSVFNSDIDENDYVSVLVDGETISKFYLLSQESIESIHVLKNDIIMVVTYGYFRNNFYFYDANLEEVKIDLVFDEEFPNSMIYHDLIDYNDNFIVKDNKIIVKLSRTIAGGELNTEDGDSIMLCDLNTGTANKNYDKYKGEVVRAKYEIEYLGNGKFDKPKRVEISQVVDESFCN